MTWLLVVSACVLPPCGGIDCGISPSYRPTCAESRVVMPSKDICLEVKKINPGSDCWAKTE